MRIELRSVGGFTGPIGAKISKIDTDTITKGDEECIINLVKVADIFSLPDKIHLSKPRPWDFLYTLTLDENTRTKTVEFHKTAAPAALQELTEKIEDIAD
jgi:hypothetical protein